MSQSFKVWLLWPAISVSLSFFAGSDSLLDKLKIYSINRGALTTLAAFLNMLLFVLRPEMFIFMIPFLPSGQLYLISVTTSLNARQSLRDNFAQDSFSSSPGVFPLFAVGSQHSPGDVECNICASTTGKKGCGSGSCDICEASVCGTDGIPGGVVHDRLKVRFPAARGSSAILAEFEGKVKKDFVGPGPYPTYTLPPRPSEQPTQPFESNAISIPVIPIPTQKSQPKPVQKPLPPPPVPVKVTYDSRHATNDYTPPLTPDTPSPTFSPASPAMSASPPTPPDGHEIQITNGQYTHLVMMADHAAELKLQSEVPKAYLKSKIGREAFAFAAPAVW
ncbi:hypothetical protein JAAARDRAFT_201088 [Jaapia argillacea MUCL 33604]|uniref:DUF6534 domain-containing protein n=1 Tax=Jaapia argillacea MUCL 33604 TaxID=933084 RepID=A0A067P2N7_9AGAM|nr:hypothetical protein JAAARDRAFT_201088 [Jaapia argillacea MUCL 33604]